MSEVADIYAHSDPGAHPVGGSPPGQEQPILATPAVVLAIYAHPDDPEVAAGGSMATWARQGAEIHICVCASGDKGSSDPAGDPQVLAATRKEETLAAGKMLGIRTHHFLGLPDGEIVDDSSTRARLVGLIRSVRPDLVLAPDPTATFFGGTYVNHRDHRQVGWLSLDAVAPAAANPHYFPAAGPPHQVSDLLLSGTLQPDFWVDIQSEVDTKARAIACHASQIGDAEEWLGPFVERRAEEAGEAAGLHRAEGFRRIHLA